MAPVMVTSLEAPDRDKVEVYRVDGTGLEVFWGYLGGAGPARAIWEEAVVANDPLLRRQAAVTRVAAQVKAGTEWAGFGNLWLVVTGDTRSPGKLCVRRFDAQGWHGHRSCASAEDAAREILDWLGTDAQLTPGTLDRMALGFEALP